MATQKSRIFSFLLNFAEKRPKDISIALGIPAPSVRRALFELRQIKAVSKPRKTGTASAIKKSLFFKEAQKPFFEYTMDMVIYAGNKREVWRVITYSESRLKTEPIINEMYDEIERDNQDRASEVMFDLGLQIKKVDSMPFEYPSMESFRVSSRKSK